MRGTSFASVWVPLLLILALFAILATLRPPLEVLWGDEGTYVAMAASLARDGDLRFDESDRRWAEERVPETGATVILQRTPKGLTYSKPAVYSILGAPFVFVFGEFGLILLNALALAIAVLLAWRSVRGRDARNAALICVAFFGCAAVLPYLVWRVSDLTQFSLTIAGLALVSGPLRGPALRDWGLPAGAVAGGLALGLVTAMRLPNAALVAAAVLACLVAARPRRAAGVVVGAALAFGLSIGADTLLAGAPNPYKAERASFNGTLGYPVGPEAATALERFETVPATQSVSWRPASDASRSLYSAMSFVIGRHTGLLLYFPVGLLLLFQIVRAPDRVGVALVLGVVAIAVFYLVWMPWNYFGGSTFVGNRYFLTSYAALLFAATRLPSPRQLTPIWVIAGVVGGSALFSVAGSNQLDAMSQNHAYAGIFRRLPVETTALEIDGQGDRYWSGDYLRFTDPYAEVGPFQMTLRTDAPASEWIVSTAQDRSTMDLLVVSETAGLELEVSDWLRNDVYPLAVENGGTRDTVEVELSRPWRRHRYWWESPALYRVRTVRLRLKGRDGAPTEAQIRYLGDGSPLDREFSLEVLDAQVEVNPDTMAIEIELDVRNTGDWTWTSEDVLPTFLSYRLDRPDGGMVEGPRIRLDREVPPGESLATEFTIPIPTGPGQHNLRVDLVVEHLAWFEDRVGRPLLKIAVASSSSTIPG